VAYKKDASATFPLIHEELVYEISGMALSDAEKGSDSSLGLFGRVVQIAAPSLNILTGTGVH
jgi:hypothetical protein